MKKEELGRYYIDMRKHAERQKNPIHKLDEKGILLFKIPYTSNFDYYPVSISLYALGNFEMYLQTEKSHYKNIFLNQVNWLVNNIKIKSRYLGIWEHNFILPYYDNFKTPWVHGMAQGLGISVLLRAYNLTNEKKYLKTAEQAYMSFETDIEEGGVRFVDDENNIWFEEYAIMPPPHILNGFIFALFGIYDLYRSTRNKKLLNLFEKGLQTLEKNLEKYDLGYWSLYNLVQKQPSTKEYHMLHIDQLNALYKISKRTLFKEYADRWDTYLHNPLNKFKVLFTRNISYVHKYGLKDSIRIYSEKRRWETTD